MERYIEINELLGKKVYCIFISLNSKSLFIYFETGSHSTDWPQDLSFLAVQVLGSALVPLCTNAESLGFKTKPQNHVFKTVNFEFKNTC